MLAIAAVAGALSFFSSRDDATTSPGEGPGVAAAVPTGPLTAALRRGDVVLRRGRDVSPAAALAVARRLAGADTPALRAAGQAVIVVPDPALTGVVARAWRRQQRAPTPADRRVQEFVDFWLGRGDRE